MTYMVKGQQNSIDDLKNKLNQLQNDWNEMCNIESVIRMSKLSRKKTLHHEIKRRMDTNAGKRISLDRAIEKLELAHAKVYPKCPKCAGKMSLNKTCGVDVCHDCNYHQGLGKCFCGWNLQPGERLEDDDPSYDEETDMYAKLAGQL